MIPTSVIYAGLAGCLIALVVATAQQKWQWKVFFLLALRLAIGWQFLFEGLNKIHSHNVGPSETNKVFTSETFFKASPTWFGGVMRTQFDDPTVTFATKLKTTLETTPTEFAKLTLEAQAAACPADVAKELDPLPDIAEAAIKKAAAADMKSAPGAYDKELKTIADEEAAEMFAAKDDKAKAAAKEKAEDARKASAKKRDTTLADAKKRDEGAKELAEKAIVASKAKYARWVYGAEGRDTKVKFVGQDVALTAPQRFAHINWLKGEVAAANQRLSMKLGNGNGTETKRAAEVRTELVVAEADLANDANAFATELKTGLGWTKSADDKPATRPGEMADRFTMYFIASVGACLLLGLFTRISCVLAAGFLVTTYLTWPAVPWYLQPPNTEGNPLFINKNLIECFALLSLAFLPTGRWMGLDAIIAYACGCDKPKKVAEPKAV